jgi:peptide-methionine (R)-S-oxide reductase
LRQAQEAKLAKIEKTKAQWKAELSPEQYRVTREHGTERAFTGPHQHEERPGVFTCVCCGKPLFRTDAKFESGTGWPSFFQPVAPDAVAEIEDRSFFMRRVEVRAKRILATFSMMARARPACVTA